jgi:CheY-like chemotaxis protein
MASSAAVGALSGLSVLVVDADMESLERELDVVQGAGAIAVGVRTATAAIALAMAARFDALVVDLSAEDGTWLLDQLCEAPVASIATPIFAITGDRHDQRYRERFTGYVLKPLNRHALVSALAGLPRRSI